MSQKSKFADIISHERLSKAPAVIERNESNPVGRPRRGKRSNPEWGPVQVLLKKETYKRAKRILMDLDNGQNMSDVLQELLERWISRPQKKSA